MKLKKIHEAVWKTAAHLEEARSELAELESQRVKGLAAIAMGKKAGPPSDEKILKAERAVVDADATVSELLNQQRAALKEELVNRAEDGAGKLAALNTKRDELMKEWGLSLNKTMLLQTEIESLDLEINAALPGISPGLAPRILEGLPSAILKQVQGDPNFLVDPRLLSDTLTTLEEEAKRRGFGGNATLRGKDGRVYYPCAGMCRITFDPQTGQVTASALVSIMAQGDAVPIDPHTIGDEGEGSHVWEGASISMTK